jgi:hypothetical protein
VNAAGTTTKAFADLDLCRRKSCTDECFGAFGFGTAIDASCACLDTQCAAQMRACVLSGVPTGDAGVGDAGDDAGMASDKKPGACDRRLACTADKVNPDHYVDCVMDHADDGEANNLLNCMREKSCGTPDGKTCPVSQGVLACVEQFAYAANKDATQVDKFTFGLQSVDDAPVVGATVIACAPPLCGPGCVAKGTGVTGADGKTTFAVKMNEGAFDGCIYVPQFMDYMGMSVVTGRRVHRDEAMLTSYSLPEGILDLYATQLDKPLVKDSTHGYVLIALSDCIWTRVAGATIEMDKLDSVTGFSYLKGLDADRTLKATTSTGAAAFINVPIGTHTITVRRDGKDIGVQTITVRARELTDVNIYPLDNGK